MKVPGGVICDSSMTNRVILDLLMDKLLDCVAAVKQLLWVAKPHRSVGPGFCIRHLIVTMWCISRSKYKSRNGHVDIDIYV